MFKRLLVAVGALLALTTTACTPSQIRAWADWNAKDPVAAQRFARQLPAAPSSGSTATGGCGGIYNEMRRQGASSGVASNFAYHIAPRESGCSAQFVHDGDDWSYSRFGLNGLTSGLRSNWANWCGADVRWDTRILSTDVRCALAAYHRMGWSPWS